MERKTKVLAAFVLGLGFGTVGISAARFFYFGAYQSFEDYMCKLSPRPYEELRNESSDQTDSDIYATRHSV